MMQTFRLQETLSRIGSDFAERVAVEWREDRITYAELEARSDKLASYLIAKGLRPQSVVALLIEDRVKLIEAILGILKAGCAFAPFSPTDPAKRLRLMAEVISPELVIVDRAYSASLSRLVAGTDLRLRMLALDGHAEPEGAPEGEPENPENLVELRDYAEFESREKPAVRSGPDDMCYLYFTSGSTGVPKAVAGRLKGLEQFIDWEIRTFKIDSGYRVSQLTVPTFDAYLRDIFVPLCAGGTVCIPESRDTVLDAKRLASWIDESRINLVHCVPSVFRSLINEKLSPDLFDHLRYVIMAGETIHPSEVKKWMDVFKEKVQLVSFYGSTELTMTKFFYFIKNSDTESKSISVGKPMEGAKAIILDDEGNICDPGVVGEIYVRTPYRTLGYYKDPELTREVFIPNPFGNDPADLIYKTGDLGRVLPDGNFELLGRKDYQVKIRGLRVELGEVESVLKSHPGVREAVATLSGEGPDDTRLVAYVVADPEQDASPGELRRFMQESLPDHMVPSAFVALDRMPMTPNGKIDRKALPAPDQSRPDLESAFVPPGTEVEKELAEIWGRVLPVEQIGINDNFFQLGGHSLLATQVISRVRERFQIDLPLRVLFEQPTIAALAEAIERLRSEQAESEKNEVLDLIEQLPDDEIDALLKQLSQEEVGIGSNEQSEEQA